MPFIVATFYHFFDFADFAKAQPSLKAELTRLGLKGSLLVASEGINGTLSGTRTAIDEFLNYLKTEIVHGEFTHKESLSDRQPFARAKVRIKKEIISLGVNPRRMAGSGMNQHQTPQQVRGLAHYVDPKDWNALINDPNTTIIDARNSYEVHLGTFDRAIDPGTRTFKQLPAFVKKNLDPKRHAKIATFCTGGIRCEKFSSWLIDQGFTEVYQLKGGILKYLEEIPPAESKWQGECFVFDERVAVGHGLAASQTASMCTACGHALTPADRKHPDYKEGKCCGFCAL